MKWLAFAIVMAGCHVELAPNGAITECGVTRLYKFDDGMYRGPQLTADQWACVHKTLGIVSDVKLNTAWPGDGGHDVRPLGVDIYDHPWQPLGPVGSGNVADTLYDLAAAPRPVYVHCLHGEDRTGLLVGLWRVAHRVPAESAWREMIAFGFHDGKTNKPGLPGLVETWEHESGWHE